MVERRSEGYAIRAKKEAKKKCETSGKQEEREANKKANTEVARSNAQAMDEVYSKSCKH